MRLFILFLSFISVFSVNAQRNCTAAANTAMPVISGQRNSLSPEQIITIPVVVHVVYNNTVENISESQIISQINSLNADFAKSNKDFSNVPSVLPNWLRTPASDSNWPKLILWERLLQASSEKNPPE